MAINYYSAFDVGAPQISGFTAGHLIMVLDACLVNGYGSKPSAGWTKEFSGTNIAVYRPPAGHRCYLRVDNSNASGYAVVQAYATMSDINTGTEPFTNSSIVNWCQSTDGVTNNWRIIVSDRSFYYIADYGTNIGWKCPFFFGDYVCRDPNFLYNTLLVHGKNATYRDNINYNYTFMVLDNDGKYCRRGWNQLELSGVTMTFKSLGAGSYIGDHNINSFPDPFMGDILIEPIHLLENNSYMGVLPGIYEPLHNPTVVNQPMSFTGSGKLLGRNLLLLDCYAGHCIFDLTGPWY